MLLLASNFSLLNVVVWLYKKYLQNSLLHLWLVEESLMDSYSLWIINLEGPKLSDCHFIVLLDGAHCVIHAFSSAKKISQYSEGGWGFNTSLLTMFCNVEIWGNPRASQWFATLYLSKWLDLSKYLHDVVHCLV